MALSTPLARACPAEGAPYHRRVPSLAGKIVSVHYRWRPRGFWLAAILTLARFVLAFYLSTGYHPTHPRPGEPCASSFDGD